MTRLLLLLAFLAACGAPVDAEPEAPGFVFTPDAELFDVATDWAATWSAATGLDIKIGEGGVPIQAVDEISGGACGHSEVIRATAGEFIRTERVIIDTTPPAGCVAWGYMLGHEIPHALGVTGHTSDPESLLSLRPKSGVEHTADASATAYACSQLDCVD